MQPPEPSRNWQDDPGVRWEQGRDHHPESKKLYTELADLDFRFNNDYFCWKSGGDGDNGETLMYLLDMIFERRDKEKR
jgi:hypothetical protein